MPNPIGIRVVLDNGELRFQQWQIRGIQDRSGRVVEFQAVGTDMTESHKNRTIEARLELTNDFVREVVHDLNNVLMALSGNIEMARLLIDNRPRLSQKLEAAESHLKRILDLTRQLHSIGNEQDPNRELVNPGEMVRELLSSLLLDSQVKWEITGDHRIYHVWFDPRELERVFLNIFQNACDAMDGVGTIRVDFSKSTLGFSSARDLGSFLRIQIYDTGCGMSKDVLARIFERDFTTKPTGKGIGLCIVSRIIHEFGGTIQARSKIGHGSVFEISLPLPE